MAQRTVSVVLSAEVMGYESAMGRASRATSSVADAGDKASSRLAKAFDSSARVAGTMFNAALAGGATLITNLSKTGIAYNSLQQNSRAALQTILGSTEAVNKQMAALDDLVSRSPFGKDTFISAQQQMLAFGIETEKVIPYLDAVQNAVAATGGSSQKLAEITFVLSQIQSAGKVTATDLMQMGQRGVDAATLVGSQMGKTSGEIREMITKGEIDVETFLDNLTAGMQAKFGGATDGIKKQWTGAVDRLKAGWREIGSSMMEPFISKEGGGMAVVWANDVADALNEAKKKAGPFTDVIVGRLMPALDRITPTIQNIRTAIAGTSTRDLERGLDSVAKNAVPLAGVAGYLSAMGTQWPILQKLGLSLNPVAGAMIGITAASPQMRAAVKATWDALQPGIEIGKQVMGVLMGIVDDVVVAAAPGFEAFGQAGAKVVIAFADLVSAGTPLLGVLVPIVSTVSDLVGVVASLPGPVLLGVAALVAMRGPATAVVTALSGITKALQPFTSTAARAFNAGLSPITAGLAGVHAQAGVVKSSLKSAGSALLGAFGGPVGLAVAAGAGLMVTAISDVTSKQREAKQMADDYRGTLDQLTGALTGATDAMIVQKLEDAGWLAKMKEWGGDTKLLVDAIKGIPGAYDEVSRIAQANQGHNWFGEQDAYKLSAFINENKAAIERQAEAARVAGEANGQLASDTEGAAVSLDNAGSAADRYREALKALTDFQAGAGKSAQDYYDAQSRLNEVMETTSETIAANNEAGKDQWSTLSNVKDSMDSYIDSMIKATDANGEAKFSVEEVGAEAERMSSGWQAFAREAGYSAEEAAALAAEIGLIPADAVTRYRTEWADGNQLDEIRAQLDGLPEEVVTKIVARDDASEVADAAANAIKMGVPVEWVTWILARDETPGVTKPMVQQLEEATKTRTAPLEAKDNTGRPVASAKSSIGSVNGKTVNINANDNASPVIDSIQGKLNAIRDRYVTVTTEFVEMFTKKSGGKLDGGWVPGLAAGGWVPGSRAGYDNVLWPLKTRSGQVLSQPLEGQEFVVNSLAASRNAPLLEAINSGADLRGLMGGGAVGASSLPAPVVQYSRVGASDPVQVHVTARLSDDQVRLLAESMEFGARRVAREWVNV